MLELWRRVSAVCAVLQQRGWLRFACHGQPPSTTHSQLHITPVITTKPTPCRPPLTAQVLGGVLDGGEDEHARQAALGRLLPRMRTIVVAQHTKRVATGLPLRGAACSQMRKAQPQGAPGEWPKPQHSEQYQRRDGGEGRDRDTTLPRRGGMLQRRGRTLDGWHRVRACASQCVAPEPRPQLPAPHRNGFTPQQTPRTATRTDSACATDLATE